MLGWARTAGAVPLLALMLISSVARSEPLNCANEVAEFVEDFGTTLSTYPNFQLTSTFLRAKLLTQSRLNPDVRDFLKKGGDPLQMGNLGVLTGIKAAYENVISQSPIDDLKKASLQASLEKAFEEMEKNLPPPQIGNGGGNGEGGGDGRGDSDHEFTPEEVQDYVRKFLDDESRKKCLMDSAVLFVVSNAVNTSFALQAGWEKYADTEKGIVENLHQSALWSNAVSDPKFRHNMAFNALLMTSLGAFRCLKNKNLGRNMLTVMAALTSAVGQYVTDGKIEIKQVIMDTLFVRYISYNKSNYAFQWAEQYRQTGRPAAWLVKASLQGLSESVGGFGYPRAVEVNNWLWGKGTRLVTGPASGQLAR